MRLVGERHGDLGAGTGRPRMDGVDAAVAAAGGNASVFGYSCGANLALKAAAGSAISRLILYEPPFNPHEGYPTLPPDPGARLREGVEADDRGGAVELYQTVAVGMPEETVVGMRSAPFRAGMEAIAHTLAYDARWSAIAAYPPGRSPGSRRRPRHLRRAECPSHA